MSKIRIWWAMSRGKVIAMLLVLWVGALVNHFEVGRVVTPIIALTTSVFFELLVSYARKRQWVFTLSAVVTGLLIGLVIDPTAGFFPILLASLVATIGKQFIGAGDHRHIWNPAAFGLFVSSVVFEMPVAWWGASWNLAPLIIVVGTVFALWKLHRLWMTGTFLLIYFFITKSLALTIDGTVFLFAFVMLTEPVTSPSGKFWRYGWGVLVGVLVAVQSYFPIFTVDPLLFALLAANLIGFLFIRRPWAAQTLLKR